MAEQKQGVKALRGQVKATITVDKKPEKGAKSDGPRAFISGKK